MAPYLSRLNGKVIKDLYVNTASGKRKAADMYTHTAAGLRRWAKIAAGVSSWLQAPSLAAAPATKPCWAIFYRYHPNLPVWKRFQLVVFDSWDYTKPLSNDFYTSDLPENGYWIRLFGAYICESKPTGHGRHEWDPGTWVQVPSPSSLYALTSMDSKYASCISKEPDEEEMWNVLVASNQDIVYNGETVFVGTEILPGEQIPYINNGVDIREENLWRHYACPDTVNASVPANWIVISPYTGTTNPNTFWGSVYRRDNSAYPIVDRYMTAYNTSSTGASVIFFDAINIQHHADIIDEYGVAHPLYLATFENAKYISLYTDSMGYSDTAVKALDGTTVVGLIDPTIASRIPMDNIYITCEEVNSDGDLVTNQYKASTILASNVDLYVGDRLFMYRNDKTICGCV